MSETIFHAIVETDRRNYYNVTYSQPTSNPVQDNGSALRFKNRTKFKCGHVVKGILGLVKIILVFCVYGG